MQSRDDLLRIFFFSLGIWSFGSGGYFDQGVYGLCEHWEMFGLVKVGFYS